MNCECQRFICEPVKEFVNGVSVDSTVRLRTHKGENNTQLIESSVVDCEIKNAGQFAAIQRHIGELSLKEITKEFMEAKGWNYEE